MLELGYNVSFDCWDWAKDLICSFYTIENIEIWVPKMQIKFWGCLNHVPLVTFSFVTSYLLMNTYYFYHKQKFGWNFMLTIIGFQCYLLHMQRIITNPSMVQSSWNFGYSFNVNLLTYVGFYFRMFVPSVKHKLLICSALTFFWK